jgi:hypothetical protein
MAGPLAELFGHIPDADHDQNVHHPSLNHPVTYAGNVLIVI